MPLGREVMGSNYEDRDESNIKEGDTLDRLEAEAIRLVNEFNANITGLSLKDKTILTCPRCLRTQAKIIGPCTNSDCYLFSEKMSYCCYAIHSNLFYPDTDSERERKVAEIAFNLSERSFNRLVELSIFALRAATIILKYLTDYSEVATRLAFHTKDMRRILSPSPPNEVLCGVCGSPHSMDKHCRCVEDNELREGRLLFQENWKRALNRPRNYESSVLKGKPKDVVSTYGKQIHSLGFTRFILTSIELAGVRFTDLPLGFILFTYNALFRDAPWRVSENLGMSEDLYIQALDLFSSRRVEDD